MQSLRYADHNLLHLASFNAIFQDGINRYLADLDDVPSGVRTLKDLIAFNELHEKEELPPGWTDMDASKYT